MSIVKSVEDLIAAIVEVFASILNTIFAAFESVFRLFATLLKDVVGLAEGFVRFLLSESRNTLEAGVCNIVHSAN